MTRLITHNTTHKQLYLRAKEMAYQLLEEIDFFVAQNICEQSIAKVEEILEKVSKVEQCYRGEVYMIICMTIIQLPFVKITFLLPKDYSQCIQTYLISLIQGKKQAKAHNSSYSDIYSGKLKKGKHSQEKKRKVMDWLFVERIDRVLAAIAREANQEVMPFKGFQQALREQLSKSLNLAKTIFSQGDYLEYRNNIEAILAVKEKSSIARERVRPQNQDKLIIIDEALITHKQSALTVPKNSFGRILPSFKNSFKYKIEKATSINEAMDSSRKNQEEKKLSTIYRSSKRGSLSSSCSKRSSTFNKSQEKQLGPRVSTRWGNKINIEVVASAFNKNRPFRRSNFQQIRSKELQFIEKEESIFFIKKHSLIIEEEVCHEKQMEATIHNLFIDGFLKSLRKMKEFYIFLQVQGTTYLASIEELKEHEMIGGEQDRGEQHFRVRVKVMNNNRSMFVLIFPSFHRGSLSKEVTCRKIITQLAYFYRNDLRIIKADTNYTTNFELNQDDETHQNIFRVSTSSVRILLGFIRKISTYFICICKYQLKEIEGFNEHDFRRRMLQQGRSLKKSISVQRQLKSTDLTLDFRIEPTSSIKKGSAIEYIEREDDQADLSLYKDGCPMKIVQNTVKQMLGVPIKVLWENSLHRHKKEKEKMRRQHRKGTASKIQKFIDRQPETKRLKRAGLNKNSIKMMSYVNDVQAGGFPQHQFFKSHQNQNRSYSRKQLNQSQKKILDKAPKHPPKQRKKLNSSKKRHFIQSIKTDKGYQLILHNQTQQITGCKYQSYFGYKQRNPKHCCYYKQETSINLNRDNFYKPTLSIHGNKKRNIQSTSLITFTKMINSEEGFQGYVVSNIKILPNSVNSDIFIETYWQAKQKYFVFVVSSDVFEKLTDINTKSFEEKPFLASSQMQQISKKRDKRTSVVASLIKDREVELLKQSSKLKKNRFLPQESSMEIQQVNQSFSREREHTKRKYDFKTLTSNQMQTMGRAIKTVDTCSTSKYMKTSLRSEAAALKRQVVARLRNKIVKYASFVWKNYRLYFQLKYNIPTQLDSINLVEFQGSELALKNAYSNSRTPDQLQGTQLILVKYSQNSLANLNFYSMEGLSKIYLQHVFIKNSADLCGRYTASISIRELIEDQRLSINYKDNNHFFEHKVQTFKISINYLRSYTSKTSSLDDQRKLKYQEILQMAKKCSIPFGYINKKKKRIMARKFIVPNRYEYFQSEDFLLQVQINDEEITIKNLQSKVLLVINIDKLEKIITFVRKWTLKTFTKAITQRILKDEDLLNLCSDKQA